MQSIKGLSELEPNWDSYGAVTVDNRSIVVAVEVIYAIASSIKAHEPTIAATPDGNVGLCWDLGNVSLDVTILPSGLMEYVFLDEVDSTRDYESRTRLPGDLSAMLSQ